MSDTTPTVQEPVLDKKNEENDDDLDLSDVPMDEHTHAQIDSDGDEFDSTIEEEEEFILDKLFHDVIESRENGDAEEDETQEPDEELDEEERLRLLMTHLDSVQMSRYEYFKRSGINRTAVKKLAYQVLNQSVSPNVAIIVSGVSKVFVGEIVQKAKEVKARYDNANLMIKLNEKKELNAELKRQMQMLKNAEKKGEDAGDITAIQEKIMEIKAALRQLDLRNVNEDGPLLPEHIREAYRLYQIENHSVPGHQWRLQGERDGMMFR